MAEARTLGHIAMDAFYSRAPTSIEYWEGDVASATRDRFDHVASAVLAASPAAPVDPATDGLPPGCRRISMSEIFKDLPVREVASPASTAGGPEQEPVAEVDSRGRVVWLGRGVLSAVSRPGGKLYAHPAPSVAPVALVDALRVLIKKVEVTARLMPSGYLISAIEDARTAVAGVKEQSHG